ncbi:MAG: IS66 family insertion sequence element accessory protein TnpB [Candidatus Brocadiales bacterium]|nr:IS66 family insertion sequence element accessory protein TnpB [Candidatus Brocadiales bacterium]
MIQVGPKTEIMVAINAIDFRCGIDSLCGLIKSQFRLDPFNGKLFIFTNKKRTGLKILAYDGQGFWFCYKRFSQGKLSWWPTSSAEIVDLDARNFILLIFNGDAQNIQFQKNWKKI